MQREGAAAYRAALGPARWRDGVSPTAPIITPPFMNFKSYLKNYDLCNIKIKYDFTSGKIKYPFENNLI